MTPLPGVTGVLGDFAPVSTTRGLHRQTLFVERERLRAEREALMLQALEEFISICAWCKKDALQPRHLP